MLNETKGTVETTLSRTNCNGSVLPNAATNTTLNSAVNDKGSEVTRPSSPKRPILSAPLFTKKLKSEGAKFNSKTEDKPISEVNETSKVQNTKGTENSSETNVTDAKKAMSLSKIASNLETNQQFKSANQVQSTRPSNPFLKSTLK